jgi:hypothetical protein
LAADVGGVRTGRRGGAVTGEEWDTRWWRIWNDALRAGHCDDEAEEIADRECVEQFGPHPEDVAS